MVSSQFSISVPLYWVCSSFHRSRHNTWVAQERESHVATIASFFLLRFLIATQYQSVCATDQWQRVMLSYQFKLSPTQILFPPQIQWSNFFILCSKLYSYLLYIFIITFGQLKSFPGIQFFCVKYLLCWNKLVNL